MKYIYIIIFLISNILFAHKNTIYERTYGNVKLISSTAYTNEQTNINFIIGKYAKILCEKLNYKDTLLLYLSNNTQENKLRWYFNTKKEKKTYSEDAGIFIFTKKREIGKCLNLIEFLILNKSNKNKVYKINKENDLGKIYEKSYSKLVLEILEIKIDRFNEFDKLRIEDDFNYYVQNDSINFYFKKNNQVLKLLATTTLIDLKTFKNQYLIVTTENKNVVIISIDSTYDQSIKETIYQSNVTPIFLEKLNLIFKPYKINLIGEKYLSFESFSDDVYIYSVEYRKLINPICD